MIPPIAASQLIRNNLDGSRGAVDPSSKTQYQCPEFESQIFGDPLPRETAKLEYSVSELGSPEIMAARCQFAPGPYELQHRPWVYHEGLFYPMHIGDVIEDRYLVLQKLGFGVYATVWLVRDVNKNRYFALKVLSSECYGAAIDTIELEVLERFKADNSKHPGQEFVSQLVDHFSIANPGGNGSHICLVFDLMAETMQTFAAKYGGSIPPWLMKRFAKQMLHALDYAHKAGVIHTDIKADNIMIQLPNESVVDERYMDNDAPAVEPSPMKTSELTFLTWPNSNHDLIRSQYGIDYESMLRMKTGTIAPHPMKDVYLGVQPSLQEIVELNIAICDWGCASWHDKHTSEDITPDLVRSPECLIEAPWDSKTDIWTLGTLLIDLLTGHNAFSAKGVHDQYDRTQHLYEVTSNFGPFPVSLLGLGNRKITIPNFDFEGEVPFPPNPRCVPPLIQSFDNLDFDDEQDKEDCLQMLWMMMQVDPRERASAEDLLQEAWLQDNKNNDLVNTLPLDEGPVEQPGHLSALSAKPYTPVQSGPPTPPLSSPANSPMQTDTTSGLGHTSALSGSSGWNIATPAVDSDATPPPSPIETVSYSQEIKENSEYLLQVQELNQSRHEQALRLLAQEHETVLGELVEAKKEVRNLEVEIKARDAIIAERDEKISELLHRFEGSTGLIEEAVAKQMQEFKYDLQQEQADAEIQLLKHQDVSHAELLTQKIEQLPAQNSQIYEEKSKACIPIMVETIEKSAEAEEAGKSPKLEIMEDDIVELAPTPSKTETGLPSTEVMDSSIEEARARAEEITLKLGLVLLGIALLLSCPKECFIVAAIGAAADSLFRILRAV